MRYYPINLDIRGKRCLVVGGGNVGTRKVDMLLKCGAKVTVISHRFSHRLTQMASEKKISIHTKSYEANDLNDIFLVIGATDDQVLGSQIAADAQKRYLLCNIADQPTQCNFILPAVVHRGDLVLAVSTSGKSPAFAKKLRQDLEAYYGEEYMLFLHLMGAIRERLLKKEHAPEAHKPLFEQLIAMDIPGLIHDQKIESIDEILSQVLGSELDGEITYHALMASILTGK